MRVFRYVLVLLCLPLTATANHHEDPDGGIYNYHEISDKLSTSGQVTDMQVPTLKSDGYALVVNLAVADPERNANEGFLVAGEGISYTQIPVVWDNPTMTDLELFFAVMDARGDRRTLVHCFANYRASAFTYLYRTLREGVPEEEARRDMEAIWSDEAWVEYPQWKTFIEDAKKHFGSR